tara:strand:+ start:2492 stop:3934 length:1443 start_codon:yes stop_codon:yes gene_type:complete
MPKLYFHPDISYQETKSIEKKYNSKNHEYLVDKASDYICEVILKTVSVGKKILVFCGPGSNGMDGIHVAIKLRTLGHFVKIYSHHQNSHMSKRYALDASLVTEFETNEYDYIVDCIFGYGLNRDLNSEDIKLINNINSTNATIFSVDVPSGLHPQTGKGCPVAIKCNTLISLLTYKRGIFTNQGRDNWDSLFHSPLVSEQIISDNYLFTANNKLAGYHISKDLYEYNSFSEHKKSKGISCIISGEQPYHGAMLLASQASMKRGCKYLHVYTDEEYAHSLPMIIPEIIAKPFSINDFEKNLSSYQNILVGPGMNLLCESYMDLIIQNIDMVESVVVDAGALQYLKKNYSSSYKLIITPHPGEAARMLGVKVEDIQNDRYDAARKLYEIFNCIVILKGSGTIIYDGKSFYTCMDGNYRMAVAGMGDILSGILLQELTINSNNLDACLKATSYHSFSADYLLKADKLYMPSMIPDVYNNLLNS